MLRITRMAENILPLNINKFPARDEKLRFFAKLSNSAVFNEDEFQSLFSSKSLGLTWILGVSKYTYIYTLI